MENVTAVWEGRCRLTKCVGQVWGRDWHRSNIGGLCKSHGSEQLVSDNVEEGKGGIMIAWGRVWEKKKAG